LPADSGHCQPLASSLCDLCLNATENLLKLKSAREASRTIVKVYMF